MRSRYNQIMADVEVSAELREKVLGNLKTNDAYKKYTPWYNSKKWIAMAACAAVIILGTSIFILRPQEPISDNSNVTLVLPPIIDHYENIDQLASNVEFTVSELTVLPENNMEIDYLTIGELAEVRYLGIEQELTLRMGSGQKDVSGVYGTYDSVLEITVRGDTVQLLALEEEILLAKWRHGDVSYSLQALKCMSKAQWQKIISSAAYTQ